MRRRTIKKSAVKSKRRMDIRKAVRAVHVVPGPSETWEIRTIGPRKTFAQFEDKEAAVDYATRVASTSSQGLIIHDDPSIVHLPAKERARRARGSRQAR